MAQNTDESSSDDGRPALYDVLRSVPVLWSLLGRHSSLCLRTVSKETRSLHDAACLSLHVHLGRAASIQKSILVGCSALLDSLVGIIQRGCQPLDFTIHADCEATLCAVIQETARSATRVAVLGSPRISDRLGATLASCVPQLQHLVLELSEMGTAKGADLVLAAVGHRLRTLELRVGSHGALPAVSLEECTALEDLRLFLDMHTLAPLGPLRMRGDEAPLAVAAIASLGTHLHSLELVGPALPRLLDPPHRLAGLSALTALTRLKVDMPAGFMAPPPPPAEVGPNGTADAGFGFAGSDTSSPLTAAGAQQSAELRWRAVPLAASMSSLAEVHLGRSYELTVYDMTVLALAPQLALLSCRNIVLPLTTAPVYTGAQGQAVFRTPPPTVPFPQGLRELQVRRLPCGPVLASLDSLPAPGLQVLRCRAFNKAVAAATAAAAAAAAANAAPTATAAMAVAATATSTPSRSYSGGGNGRGNDDAAVILPTTAPSSDSCSGGPQPMRLGDLPASMSASASFPSASSAVSFGSTPPFVVCATNLSGADLSDCGAARVFKGKQPAPEHTQSVVLRAARLSEADLAGPDLDLDFRATDSGPIELPTVPTLMADMAKMHSGSDSHPAVRSSSGGEATSRRVLPPAEAEEALPVATVRQSGSDRGAAAGREQPLRGSNERLRLALVGSWCTAESIDADPWVGEIALGAFRILARLMFTCPRPQPPSRPLTGTTGATSYPIVLPALSIRPFERGGRSGRGGSAGAASSASAACTTLRGPYAGTWLAALEPLGAAGLSALQLRHFEFAPGDLLHLQVAVPELKDCELRECSASEDDVRQLRGWLQRPKWGGELRSDLPQ